MTEAGIVCPVFDKPPVVETIIGVQFAPLRGLRSSHYGWFWSEYLKSDGWVTTEDEPLIPTYEEKFGELKLNLTKPGPPLSNSVPIRMKCRNATKTRSVQLQPDKLYYTWNREDQSAPRYGKAKVEFVKLFQKLEKFALEAGIGPIEPNLWDVTYVNQIPSGELWEQPRDWHKVLPAFFSPTSVGIDGVKFATYDGNWHFEIEPRQGRLHVNVAKMIRNGASSPVLFLKLVARGEVTSELNWSDGLDLGHKSCVDLFLSLTSQEAHKSWRLQDEHVNN